MLNFAIHLQILLHPHDITVFEDYVYWTDRQSSSISRVHKYGADRGEETVTNGILQPSAIHSLHPVRQPKAGMV